MERRRKRHKTVFLENRNSSELLYKYNNGTTSNELHFVKDPLHNQKPRPTFNSYIGPPIHCYHLYSIIHVDYKYATHEHTQTHTLSLSLALSLSVSLSHSHTHHAHIPITQTHACTHAHAHEEEV